MREKNKIAAGLVLFALCGADLLLWQKVLAGPGDTALYFLDVGQGDSEVLVSPELTMLTDAGPDRKILDALAAALPGLKRIDLALISHPQLDHFNGYNFLLDKYEIGAFIVNGRTDSPGVTEWTGLLSKIKSKNIPLLTLGAGDRVKTTEAEVDLVWPPAEFRNSSELNDTGLVEMIRAPGWKALLAADVDTAAEDYLAGQNIRADILKVAHHGSKYSSSGQFLAAVRPKIAVIEVGAKNTYGHPAADTLSRLISGGARIFRTDQNGTVKISAGGNSLLVSARNLH